jgi:hypothetical protein
MSCCGFDYKGSQVKKSHLTGKPYLYLEAESLFASPKLKEILCDICLRSDWKFDNLRGGYVDFYSQEWPKGHPWSSKDEVHFYERAVLNIYNLNEALKVWKDSFREYAYIRDGNHKYKSLSTYWQYEPAETWFVNPKTWEELP